MVAPSFKPLAKEPSADALRSEEEHLRMSQEAGEIGTWDWDLVSGRMKWSAQMFRNMGVPPGSTEDLYAALIQAIHHDERETAAAAFADFRNRVGPLRLETRLASPENAARWMVFLGRVAADASGSPCRMLGITLDSTRRRQFEEEARAELRELNERLEQHAEERARQLNTSRAQMQALFDNSPDWLTLFRAGSDGRFIYEDLNRATEAAYGMRREQVIGRPLEEVLGDEQAQLPLRLMRACIATGENQRYTARRTLAGVSRTIDVMFVRVPERDARDYFIMATARDITEREAIAERLRQSQKMEAVGQLTGGVAHDFNNLLTAVVGNLELAAHRAEGDAATMSHLAAALRAAENGARLVQQLLAFSRRQHLQPRAINLNDIIDGMRQLLARTIGTIVRINTVLTPDLWPALVDPTQIEVAILNLAINARDAMPLGGTLTIETRNLRHGRDAMPLEAGDQDCICVSVRDGGTGMSEAVLQAAVEPFFTTKEPGKGSGLGLSQVYGTVRQSNGALRIESDLGSGTAVHLYLPRAASAETVVDGGLSQPREERSSGRLLVVDDDPGVREVTVQMLRELGYGVTEAESGYGALDALARGEVYDLMVIDVAMPGLDGIETVRRARERWPRLRVLYVTGYADFADIASRTGEDPQIRKPFRLMDFAAGVRAAIHRSPGIGGAKVVNLRDLA